MIDLTITKVKARQVFDGRAYPTVEAEVHLACGAVGRAIVPAGASTGQFEALELRDGDPNHFEGKGVLKAIANIENIIAPKLIGKSAYDQASLDKLMIELDGTPDKSRLGANAILGCSMAIAWAAANALGEPLFRYLGGANSRIMPMPIMQIFGGGAHAPGCLTDVQDFAVIPIGAKSFSEAYEMGINIYRAARKIYNRLGRATSTADAGALWPVDFKSTEEGFELITEAIINAGYIPGVDVGIASDVAASEFYDEEKKVYRFRSTGEEYTSTEFIDLLEKWVDKYAIVSLEDVCQDSDWDGWKLASERLCSKIQVIGDDLFTTNLERVKRGISEGVANAVLIKINQIGTISETLEVVEYAKANGYLPVVSTRSGETEDTTAVHLTIAANLGQFKLSAVRLGERTAKWNEGIRIEEFLGDAAIFQGGDIYNVLKYKYANR